MYSLSVALWWIYIRSTVYGRKLWRFWAKSLGEKSGSNDREADIIALIRTILVLWTLLTNVFIISGVLRHW